MKTFPLAVLFATIAFAQTNTFVIRDARVFDGEKLLPRASVVVTGGKIVAIGDKVRIPSGAAVIDGSGKTLLPGFIDAHTHTFPAESLRQAPIFGVTTTLDMFTDPKLAADVKKQEAAGSLWDSASLFSAGFLATVPGGHGTEYPIKVPTLTRPEEAQAWVDARIAEGSDYIKIISDDMSAYGSSRRIPTLDKETIKAIVDAAHKRGKLAVIHIGSEQEAKEAIQAGVDGLAHIFVGPTVDPDFGSLVAAHHAFVIPTLSVYQGFCGSKFDAELSHDPALSPYIGPAEATNMGQTFSFKPLDCSGTWRAIGLLKSAHVPLLTGSDAPNPGTAQGVTVHGEMELLVRNGLTPVEALRAATSNAATAFHLKDRGRIAPGLRADLVLVNGDPTADIKATRNISQVWEAGREIDRAAWKASVEKQREEAAKATSKPAPPGSESGLVSDFEGEKPSAQFGSGWMVSTDSMAGGKSTAKFEVVPGGANASKGALRIAGEVMPGFAVPWAGAMFSPGQTPMAPANLSSKKAITFWTKGDGATYEVMIFAQSRGYRPITKTFVAGPEWKQVSYPLSAFDGTDGHDIMALVFCAGPNPGKFDFLLDDVKFQ